MEKVIFRLLKLTKNIKSQVKKDREYIIWYKLAEIRLWMSKYGKHSKLKTNFNFIYITLLRQ